VANQAQSAKQLYEAVNKQVAASALQAPVALMEQLASSSASVQRAVANPRLACPADMLSVQRVAGNRAVLRLIQAKRGCARCEDDEGLIQTRLRQSDTASSEQHDAEAATNAALTSRPIGSIVRTRPAIQRRAAPYIKKITVHLTPHQSADLEWKGTAPDDAPGKDHFTVSTGKGYSDPGDPRGTCSRTCCQDPMTQCAPPWNQPGRVGACCTYYGENFWTGTPLEEHNGWKWWTPIQPYYSSRGIALHQHDEVTGQPIGHGCVRMKDENAKRIYDFSNGRRTNVTIDGRAAPVACDPDRQCKAPAKSKGGSAHGELDQDRGDSRIASESQDVVPGQEGVLT
jgi:hypothetical protein